MDEKERTVRKAKPEDIPSILDIVADAVRTMRASGNLRQWTDGYPSRETIATDIRNRVGYLVTGPSGQADGYFAMIPSPEPTYAVIYGGEWLDDSLPYRVIHRIAGRAGTHGIFSAIMDHAFSVTDNVRIDTHADNAIMQHNILKHGFRFCGTILLANGDPRLAYQKLLGRNLEKTE
jgi:hypothetical protein